MGPILADGPEHTAPVRGPDTEIYPPAKQVYTRPDGLRYDPDAIMDMPRGAMPRPGDMSHPPKVEQKSGPDLARTLLFAQLPLDPYRLSAQKSVKMPKLNSAQRRAKKIAEGRLWVDNGKLCGF